MPRINPVLRPFFLFLFARSFSTLASQMELVAVGWQVYSLTGRVLDLGLVGLFQFLPSIMLVLLVGHVADRYDRRTILRICMVIEGLAATGLALGSAGGEGLTGWIDVQAIFGLVFLVGVARAFGQPTMQAFVSNLVPREHLPRAIALNASVNKLCFVLGPALGGFIYVAGPVYVYGITAVMFMLAVILTGWVHIPRIIRAVEPVTLRSVFAGLAFIRSRPVMFGAISLDLFAVLLGGATALLPAFAQDILHTGPWGLGLLRAAPALGAFPTALWIARHPLGRRVGRTMMISVAVFGVATIVFALSTSFALSMLALIVLGASDMVSVVIRSSMVQLYTPDEMRGRVSAVNSVFIGSSNELGEFESGVLAALVGTVGAVLIGGVGTVLVVLLWARYFPELARFDRLGK
jgi:MFS family permease